MVLFVSIGVVQDFLHPPYNPVVVSEWGVESKLFVNPTS